MDTAYLKKVGQTLVFAIISLFFIFYIGYHIYTGFSTDIITVLAEKDGQRIHFQRRNLSYVSIHRYGQLHRKGR